MILRFVVFTLFFFTCFFSRIATPVYSQPHELLQVIPPEPVAKTPSEEKTTTNDVAHLDIVYVADMLGRFFTPDCLGNKPRSYLRPLSQVVQILEQQSVQAGRTSLVLGGGNLFSPDAIGHYLLSTLSGALFVSGEFHSMNMAASAWGPMDLLAPESVITMVARILFRQDMPLVATNAVCAKGQETFCKERIQSSVLFEAGNIRIGLMVLFPEKFTSSLPKDTRKWLSFSDPVKTYETHRKRLLQQGAHLIFVVSHLDTENTFPSSTLAFLRALSVPEPSLVFTTSAQHPSPAKTSYISLIQRTSGALIVGTSRLGRSVVQLHLQLRSDNNQWRVDANASHAVDIPVNAAPMTLADPGSLQVTQFCTEFNRPLGNNVIDPPMDANAFLQYILGILRTQLRTEIAIINRDAINPYDFPVSGPVTRELLVRLLRTDSSLVIIKIKGKAIKELLGPFSEGKNQALAIVGLEKTPNGFTVNKRNIDDEMHYAVATTQYVALGGGGILPVQKNIVLQNNRLHTVVMQHFLQRSSRRPNIHLHQDFPDLWKNYIWNAGSNLGMSLGHSNVARSGVYADKPKLTGQDLTSTNMDITLFTELSNMHQALSARSRFLYGKTWTSTIDAQTQERVSISKETADEIRLNMLYQLKTPKNTWWKGRWWAPVPFVDAGLTTEFTPSLRDESLRSKVFSVLAGAGLEVWENRLFFKAGGGLRRDVGEEDTRTQQTLYAGWQLNNGDLFPLFQTPLKGESRLDFYVMDSNGNPRAYEIQAASKLYFAINNRIFLNFTHDIYAFKRAKERWSWAMDFLFGINVLFDVRVPFIVY